MAGDDVAVVDCTSDVVREGVERVVAEGEGERDGDFTALGEVEGDRETVAEFVGEGDEEVEAVSDD